MKYRSLEKRIYDLETKNKASNDSFIWISMMDNEVRVIRGKMHEKPREFETVFQAGKYVEEWMQKSKKVCGICMISNITDLLYEHPLTEVPDSIVNIMGVVMNLAKCHGDLADVAMATWWFLHKQEFEVETP